MPTYRSTARNQFRSPSGAVGEAPDGPGAMATMLDDVDNFLGVGGAEYSTGFATIPTGRKFAGKLAYHQPSDVVYRYVGAGNTALGSNGGTNQWQAWSKPATAFTPSWIAGITIGSSVVLGQYGISEGLAWISANVTAGASYAVSATVDVSMNLPTPMVCGFPAGSGLYVKAGGSGNNTMVDLATYVVGINGQTSTQVRVRGKWANAAPGAVFNNILGSVLASTTTDTFQFLLTGPSALVA